MCLQGVWMVSDELDLLFRRMLCNTSRNLLPTERWLSQRSAVNPARAFKVALERGDQVTTHITSFNK